jgi:hypothetical protein
VTVIGRMEAGQREDGWGTKVIDDAGHKIETGKGGFRHF